MDPIKQVNNILNSPPSWKTIGKLFGLITDIIELELEDKNINYTVYLLLKRNLYGFVEQLYLGKIDITDGFKLYILSKEILDETLLDFIHYHCNFDFNKFIIEGMPFLHYAVCHTDLLLTKYLLSKNINIFIKDEEDHDVMYYICKLSIHQFNKKLHHNNSLNKIIKIIQKKYSINNYPDFWKPYKKVVIMGFSKNMSINSSKN